MGRVTSRVPYYMGDAIASNPSMGCDITVDIYRVDSDYETILSIDALNAPISTVSANEGSNWGYYTGPLDIYRKLYVFNMGFNNALM